MSDLRFHEPTGTWWTPDPKMGKPTFWTLKYGRASMPRGEWIPIRIVVHDCDSEGKFQWHTETGHIGYDRDGKASSWDDAATAALGLLGMPTQEDYKMLQEIANCARKLLRSAGPLHLEGSKYTTMDRSILQKLAELVGVGIGSK